MGMHQDETKLFFEQLEAYFDEFMSPILPEDAGPAPEAASLSEEQVAKLAEDLSTHKPQSTNHDN